MMEVKQRNSAQSGRFFIEDSGKIAATMDYSWEGGNMVIEHTVVKPEFEGKGLGKALVNEAVRYARENKILIKPLCSYAKKVLERSVEYKDILI